MSEPSLGEVGNDALLRPPLLCKTVDDGYGFSWFILEPPLGERADDALRKPFFNTRPRKDDAFRFVGCRYGELSRFSWLMGDPIVSKLELEPPMDESSPRKDDALRKPLFL